MNNTDPARRALLASLVWALALPSVALAQDPRASEAQQVARGWLALVDKLDYSATWKMAGQRFQATIAEDRWTALLKREREARGALVQRAVAGTSFTSQLPSVPEAGRYAMVHFRTSFVNEPNATEDITLEQGPDSTWRVIGYVIH
jgi:hypothetical protein